MKKFRLTGDQHGALLKHLYSGDNKESVALIICEQANYGEDRLWMTKEIIAVPDSSCSLRNSGRIVWPTERYLIPLIQQLDQKNQSLIIIHSHPTGFPNFSSIDDNSDRQIFSTLYACLDDQGMHGSAIMFSDGRIIARHIDAAGVFNRIDKVVVAGDRIRIFEADEAEAWFQDYSRKNEQVFGKGTLKILSGLKVGVVGLSGTGSPTVDLLLRHNVGEIIAIDFDHIDQGNLNRISVARVSDAFKETKKVDRYSEWIAEVGLPTNFTGLTCKVRDQAAIEVLAGCDVLIGSVDNASARHFINILSCAYLIPLFDLGVGLKSSKVNTGEITHAIAKSHYVRPDRACLMDRGVYTSTMLAAENYKETDPGYYDVQRAAGYLEAVGEDQPAVMVMTANAANMGVEDLLARLHGYRIDPDDEFDEQERSFIHGYYQARSHPGPNKILKKFIGVGNQFRSLI